MKKITKQIFSSKTIKTFKFHRLNKHWLSIVVQRYTKKPVAIGRWFQQHCKPFLDEQNGTNVKARMNCKRTNFHSIDGLLLQEQNTANLFRRASVLDPTVEGQIACYSLE